LKYRAERIEKSLIHEVMRAIANHEVKDPRIPSILTITKVTVSKDLHYCHFYFSMIGSDVEKKRALLGLNSAKGFFQKIIAERVALRFTPKIEFRLDSEEETAYKIDSLLDDLSKERETREKNI
jgi:ribosome-binding factor A